MSNSSDLLRTLLQLHLASDALALTHLTFVLGVLTPDVFHSGASHLPKWTARVNSLIQARDTGARWAGLVLALKTAELSKECMMQCAPTWVPAALSILGKPEPPPNQKIALRLLDHIFTEAPQAPEFQRQIATPNVPKLTAAILALLTSSQTSPPAPPDVCTLALHTTAHLLPLYPTLHRINQLALSAMCLRVLEKTAPENELARAASLLYAALPHTGGKSGAAGLWRKAVDANIAYIVEAFVALRTTVTTGAELPHLLPKPAQSISGDPLVSIPAKMQQLRCGMVIIQDLLRTPVPRNVTVPVGAISLLCTTLLSCVPEDYQSQDSAPIDPMRASLELSALPVIRHAACDLLCDFVSSVQYHITPYASRLLACIVYHLESSLPSQQRLSLLRAACSIVQHSLTLVPAQARVQARLAKAVLRDLSNVLAPPPSSDADSPSTSTKKKGKKRTRNYEGDELFSAGRIAVCATQADGEALVAALDAIDILLTKTPSMAASTRSIASRIMLALFLELPHQPPAALCGTDPNLHACILSRVRAVCVKLGVGGAGTSALGRSLPLVSCGIEADHDDLHRELELLFHPRMPPLLRALPHVEALALFRAEEGIEEAGIRQELGVVSMAPERIQPAPHLEPLQSSVKPLNGAALPAEVDMAMDQPVSSQNAARDMGPAVQSSDSRLSQPSPPDELAPGRNPIVPSTSTSVGSTMAPPVTEAIPSATAAAISAGKDAPGAIQAFMEPSSAVQVQAQASDAPPLVTAPRAPLVVNDDDEEDEQMPGIDLSSDSEG